MEKINKLKKLFNYYNLDGYIVPKNDEFFGEYIPENKDKLKFISNFSGSYGFALILKKKNYLFVDGRYTLQAKIQSGKYFKIMTIPNKFPAEISGGMKKRVGIARAIALDIKYLFCDEPNSGLDPVTSRVIDELLKSITEEFNITTIINTHDMKTVFDIGDDVIFIYKGKKEWSGKVKDIHSSNNDMLTNFIKASYFD